MEDLVEAIVFAGAQACDGVRGRGVIGVSVGQVDASRTQEAAHAIGPRLAVHKLDVVVVGERLLTIQTGEETVEHVGPCTPMNIGRRSDHSVEVKQNSCER